MADRIERMLENQKKREAAMAAKAQQAQATQEAQRKEALARMPTPAVSAAAAAADLIAPLENNRKLQSTAIALSPHPQLEGSTLWSLSLPSPPPPTLFTCLVAGRKEPYYSGMVSPPPPLSYLFFLSTQRPFSPHCRLCSVVSLPWSVVTPMARTSSTAWATM